MTDRASAEGLRRYRAIINANGAMEFIEDPDGPLVTYADVAALRDTGSRPPSDDGGPRPDSGIDEERLARAMHASEVGCARPTSLCVWEAPFSESHRALATAIAAEYARLATPRTGDER